MTRRTKNLAIGALALLPALAVGVVRERLAAKVPMSVAVDTPQGLTFRLSQGKPALGGDTGGEEIAAANGTPLSDADADRVLARLASIKEQTDDTKGFSLRESSLPEPRAGETVHMTFPPPPSDGAPPAVETGPLAVRRVTPEGDVNLADRVSITFSQPMVPVTSQEEANANVPATLTPGVPGQWRWLGTQTLIFDAGSGKRLPMATAFTLKIPAGTKSETGGALSETKVVHFRTPAVRLLASWPNSSEAQTPTPVIWMEFDQAVDPDAVIKTIALSAGSKPFPVRRATTDEVAALKNRGATPTGALANRVVAIRPVEPLPLATTFTVNVGPGTPSLEGPRTTEAAQSFSFATYSPLQFLTVYGNGNPPGSGWTLMFNNALDEEAFDPATVKLTPPMPGVRIMAMGSYGSNGAIAISGATRARAKYKVTILAGLKDIFGQTLGAPVTVDLTVGDAVPRLEGPQQPFIVCDPATPLRAVFRSIDTPSMRVSLYAVEPSDWPAFLNRRVERGAEPATPPGRLISNALVPLKARMDDWGDTDVDIRPALKNGLGNVVVQWEASIHRPNEDPDRGVVWLQATHLGLMAQNDSDDLYTWVTDLASGKPSSGAAISLESISADGVSKTSTVVPTWKMATVATGISAGDGMSRLPLPTQGANVLIVRKGADTAFLPAAEGYGGYYNFGGFRRYGGGSWVRQPRSDTSRWFIFDDRRLYRPGETVHIKGWERIKTPGVHGDLRLPTDLKSVSWQLTDSRGNKVAGGTTLVNAWAGFDFSAALPKTMNLGNANFTINGIGHGIDVQEFRRPEFEVSAKNESAGPFVVGDPKGADLSVSAKYYAGGALPGTSVTWNVTAAPTSYAPPGHEGFTFGRWIPWWGALGFTDDEDGFRPIGRLSLQRRASVRQSLTGTAGADGTHYLHLDFDSVRPARPYTVSAQAVVQDVSRQTLAANTSLIVHPSERYVGLRGRDLFVATGKPLTVDAIVTDIDGKIEADSAVQFRAARKEWEYKRGRWQESDADIKEWSATSGAKPVTTDFTPTEGGQWTLKATVRDAQGRPNESELTLWVAGGAPPHSEQRGLQGQQATLIPDHKEYSAGQTATVLVQSPFPNAEGLATVTHDGVVNVRRFTMVGSTYTLHVPIEEWFLPSAGLQVELVGSAPRAGDDGLPVAGIAPRPAFASGHLDLSVPPTSRALTVTAVPDTATLTPGGKTTVTVRVKDAGGKPVANADATVSVVDESVLALGGWSLGDPLTAFYSGVNNTLNSVQLRSLVLLDDPTQVLTPSALPRTRNLGVAFAAAAPQSAARMRGGGSFGGGGGRGEVFDSMMAADMPTEAAKVSIMGSIHVMEDHDTTGGTPIAVRQNFDALAAFVPSVPTNADGVVRVPITLPDNLTRYRIVAVAVAGAKQVGHGEAAITARLPLMARPSAPRFLNYGDKFELPVVLQNQTDQPMDVDVAIRGSNLAFGGSRGYHVTVKANDRVEVRFPAQTLLPGTARFQIAATSGAMADAAEGNLPVYTPATTEAFATYGVVDDGATVQPVQAPANVIPRFGGLEVTTSSTALQELTDALLYLDSYPYDCAEQVSSRVLANAALKDVLTAFHATGLPAPAQIEAQMGRDMARLSELQRRDGAFGFWTPDTRPYPFLGVHVAHTLVVARAKGFDVPRTLYDRSMAYVKNIDNEFIGTDDYSVELRRMIRAYALSVRHLNGEDVAAEAKTLIAEDAPDHLGPETIGWLLEILAGDHSIDAEDQARVWLKNHVTETAEAAHFSFSYGDGNYLALYSNRRADAIALSALIADQPKSDLIPKLVRGLLDGRKRGHWQNTQEDAFVLLALDRYFHTYENATPDFVARIWLGNRVAGAGAFHGRSTDRVATDIPMEYLAQTPGVQKLTIDKQGAGRLYYRVGMRYAPSDLNLKPADYGFSVQRTYEAIDKPTDVRRDPDGTWVIRAGAKVRVRLTMVATTRRYHVALVDPLPAGFESLNSDLRGTESFDRDTNRPGAGYRGWWPWWHWWEHENLRDDRAEAFTSLLWEGAYEYAFVCRATTPGEFVVPPAKAEEMYAPETFGRSGTDRVWVK